MHATNVAIVHLNKRYPKYTFLRTSIKRKGRPNLLSGDMMAKVKTIMIGTRAAGTAISRRIVIVIENGVARGILKSMGWFKRKGTTG